jgi:16S rRNA (guanine(966)-N(2))-methyltransferase RsmD
MRIVSGTHKGRQIHPPSNLPVRPTTDFAKESLFDILANRLNYDELNVLDLFAGTGSISFEFASRGAAEVTSVDMNYKCVEFIRRTAADFGFANLRPVRANVISFLDYCKVKYDLIFADPPYDLNAITTIPDKVMNNGLLNKEGILILEHSRDNDFSKHPLFTEHRIYGKVNFSFFKQV